jgi:hypothetical protein
LIRAEHYPDASHDRLTPISCQVIKKPLCGSTATVHLREFEARLNAGERAGVDARYVSGLCRISPADTLLLK